ncbi:hypothetical protein [Flavobacterium cerinum]|uniref:Uncharacterized protein n=1 Tax=Flavobacterium cerinum TaxID=2502784 RepID=A0A444HA42_9FLAO|nr:hypothetical protein [Flavobacterium cerinum]RWX00043.1 hypothetical protein EPI11_10900 [Flavobacterium cerinum]
MAKLSPAQIQFVDDYLYNAGVYYIDIRYEMTDHVATALEAMEGTFQQNFFGYMASHKRELLASNKKFKSGALSRACKSFWDNYTNPKFLISIAVFAFFVFAMANQFGYDQVYGYFFMSHLAVCVSFYVSWVYFWVVKKNRYSVVDKLLVIGWFIPILFNIEESIESKVIRLVFITFYSSIILALFITIASVRRKYKLE